MQMASRLKMVAGISFKTKWLQDFKFECFVPMRKKKV